MAGLACLGRVPAAAPVQLPHCTSPVLALPSCSNSPSHSPQHLQCRCPLPLPLPGAPRSLHPAGLRHLGHAGRAGALGGHGGGGPRGLCGGSAAPDALGHHPALPPGGHPRVWTGECGAPSGRPPWALWLARWQGWVAAACLRPDSMQETEPTIRREPRQGRVLPLFSAWFGGSPAVLTCTAPLLLLRLRLQALLMAFGTSSSAAALPLAMEAARAQGCEEATVNFFLPLVGLCRCRQAPGEGSEGVPLPGAPLTGCGGRVPCGCILDRASKVGHCRLLPARGGSLLPLLRPRRRGRNRCLAVAREGGPVRRGRVGGASAGQCSARVPGTCQSPAPPLAGVPHACLLTSQPGPATGSPDTFCPHPAACNASLPESRAGLNPESPPILPTRYPTFCPPTPGRRECHPGRRASRSTSAARRCMKLPQQFSSRRRVQYCPHLMSKELHSWPGEAARRLLLASHETNTLLALSEMLCLGFPAAALPPTHPARHPAAPAGPRRAPGCGAAARGGFHCLAGGSGSARHSFCWAHHTVDSAAGCGTGTVCCRPGGGPCRWAGLVV